MGGEEIHPTSQTGVRLRLLAVLFIEGVCIVHAGEGAGCRALSEGRIMQNQTVPGS